MNQPPMDIETLYLLVSESIRRAEMLEDLGAPGAAAAHLDVSLIEEKIAGTLPATDTEGTIARRGAVRAALAAKDRSRAQSLVTRFTAESGVTAELKKELADLIKDANSAIDEWNRRCCPRASARYGFDDVSRVIHAWLLQGEAFPIV